MHPVFLMVRDGLYLVLCCFVTVEGTVDVRLKKLDFSHGAWIYFFSPNILAIGTVDMLLHSHLWIAASSSSFPLMDLLSGFVDNPLIKYECSLVIFAVTRSVSKMCLLIQLVFRQCWGKTVPSLF